MKPRRLPGSFETPIGRVRVIRRKPEDNDAIFDVQRMVVMIDPELTPDRARSTLLHEVMHCCFAVYGHVDRWTSQQEESFIGFLEPLLYDVLTRNGWLRMPCYGKVGGHSERSERRRVEIQATWVAPRTSRHPGRERKKP